jgi:hypothetical protein
MRSLTLPVALLLAACTTPQEHAARVQAEMEQNIAVYGPACARLGYPPNSDQWRSCVLQLSTKEDLERYGNYPSYYGGFGAGHWRGGGFWGPYW